MIRRVGRNVVVLGVVSFFTDIASEMLYPLIPLFLTGVLGAPMTVVGVIEGLAESTASLLKVVSGWASDRVGRRRPFVVGGYGISASSKPLLALATAWPMVLVARVVDRIGKGLRTSPRDAIIAASTPLAHRGEAYGLHRAMDTAGAALGPIFAIVALSWGEVEYRLLFWLATIPAVLGVATLALLRRPPAPAPVEETGGERWPRVRRALTPDLKRFLLVIGVFALGNSSDVFLLLKARDLGYTDVGVLWIYVFYNVCFALASTPAGRLSDRWGRGSVITGGLLLFAGVYLGFAAGPAGYLLWGLFALYGLYAAATEGILKAHVADLSSPAVRGTAMGAMQTLTGLLAFGASAVAGLLWTYVGSAATFLYGSACALAAALLFQALCGDDPGVARP